jgi:hypothetical protein
MSRRSFRILTTFRIDCMRSAGFRQYFSRTPVAPCRLTTYIVRHSPGRYRYIQEAIVAIRYFPPTLVCHIIFLDLRNPATTKYTAVLHPSAVHGCTYHTHIPEQGDRGGKPIRKLDVILYPRAMGRFSPNQGDRCAHRSLLLSDRQDHPAPEGYYRLFAGSRLESAHDCRLRNGSLKQQLRSGKQVLLNLPHRVPGQLLNNHELPRHLERSQFRAA